MNSGRPSMNVARIMELRNLGNRWDVIGQVLSIEERRMVPYLAKSCQNAVRTWKRLKAVNEAAGEL